VLDKFLLADTDDLSLPVEQDCPARRGSLVDGEDESVHGVLSSLMQIGSGILSGLAARMQGCALNDLSKMQYGGG
jgi:hypothetical protein